MLSKRTVSMANSVCWSISAAAVVLFGCGSRVFGQDSMPPTHADQILSTGDVERAPITTRIITGKYPIEMQIEASSSPDPDDLGTASRLTLRSPNNMEVSGDYRIDSNSTISVPVIGRLNVKGMKINDLERDLSERLSKISGHESYVAIEVAEYRSVYVTGLVNNSGANPWKPGMTVIQAVAVCGGLYRERSATGVLGGGEDAEMTRLLRATTEQKRLLAALARLYSERDGSDEITLTERLVRQVGKKEASELVAAQSNIFKSDVGTHTTLRKSLQQEIELGNGELDALTKQMARVDEQIGLRTRSVAGLDSLSKKGLALNERILDEKLKVAELEDKQMAVMSDVAKTKGLVSAKERELIKLDGDWRAKNDADIDNFERQAALLDIDIDAARIAYRKLTGRDAESPSGGPPKEVAYRIIRRTGEGQQTLKVDQLTSLWPGDVLVVETGQNLPQKDTAISNLN